MTKYFGRPWPSGLCDSGTQVPTPIGVPCLRCEELIEAGDQGVIDWGGSVMHKNCNMRSITGSVAHVEERCSCVIPGAEEWDDPNLSRRDAADAAVAAWEKVEWSKLGYSFAIGSDRHGDYILCFCCNLKSYHPQDIINRFCGKCNQFHEIPKR